MSSKSFIVTEHWSPCQHFREYPHGAKRDDALLELAVKEYQPRNNLNVGEDSITIIAAHGNGFPKETYEPLFDELLDASSANHLKIRSIWIADQANQGASYARNAELLGDDPCWLDHSRDLLLMLNHFREKMKPPFVGLAHSMGCAQLAYLSLIHPRLFHSLILIDPVIQDFHPPGPNAAMFSSIRREQWDSRAKTEAGFRKNPFFQSFDPRCLDLFLAHALRDTLDGGVALATPKAQEAWSYIRSNFQPFPKETASREARERERLLNPECIPGSKGTMPIFTGPDVIPVYENLPHLRPRTLYVYGDFSTINHEEVRELHISKTGIGRGGNGGVADGGVEQRVIEDAGHLCVFEKPTVIAKDVAEWLGKEMTRWRKERGFWATVDTGKSKNERKELSDKWIAAVKEDAYVQRPKATDGSKL